MSDLLETPLFDLHQELGAKMVPFAGYSMPVQYGMGVMKEHVHTRTQAGLFDVSHMGQLVVSGEGAADFIESLIPIDVQGLGVDRQRYGFFTNESGGILDDLMVTRREDHFLIVVNAACTVAVPRGVGDGVTVPFTGGDLLLSPLKGACRNLATITHRSRSIVAAP